ncbi:MAG: mismatch-specific DNA-glycosylase [Pseudolysinimonas sp.]
MPTFTRAQLESFRGGTLPDLMGPGTRLLFVGFNPGLRSVAVQAPFSLRSNRFWATLYRAGILNRLVDASEGMDAADRAHIIARGVGLTSLVRGATARADELTPAELVAGAHDLERRVTASPPHVVAILGITAYRIAFGVKAAVPGEQSALIAGVPIWVVPNPSGLNAHATPTSLAAAYRQAAIAAGIEVLPEPQ